ncbi:diacylglycerol kinase family lipid kinase [Phytoactinopolyspora alkaliphila]|uniref:Diacylglycerol kinase family lipid kinase n=1 Tax=Phytoactinopolyspora alkaliphila TaxID=1783498 RepID=A0A6N9YR94_9ACTN|nr:diacylglycerol kinase family protein [Phytoactinopolyspora alkaliphila]NED97467.1 diacylglycerol kinase family lipid kinase [Phytoactinopolyspora alkaliphila]
MRTFTAVVNPHAGGPRRGRRGPHTRLSAVTRLLEDAGAKVTTEHSHSLDHAAQLATVAAERGDVVLAVGGDGTVGALAAAVVPTGGILGIIPAGRGNDFARQLALPHEPEALSRIFHTSEPRAVDVIEAAGRTVVGSVYTGIDAVAAEYVAAARSLGGAAYHYAAVRALAAWKPVHYRVLVDGQEHTPRGYTVVVANSGYYGNGRHAAPAARVDDGILDVIVLTDVPKRSFVSIAMRELYAGTHVRRPEILVMRAREVVIEADRELRAGGDGEVIGPLPMTVRVRPGALRVLAGAATS